MSRLKSKKDLEDRVGAVAARHRASTPENIHIGPSDYVPWQNDNKVCFLRMEGRGFGDVPMNLELRLSVEDSPNSAGVVIDARPLRASSAWNAARAGRWKRRRPIS